MEPNPSDPHLERLFRIPTDHMDREAILYLEHRENKIYLVMITWIHLVTKQFMFPKLMRKHYAKRVCEDANHTGWACRRLDLP